MKTIILTALCSFLLGRTIATIHFQNQVEAYHNYYQKTETLLDSIDDNYFLDVLMETDTYFYYEESRDNLINKNLEIANYKNTK